ncbi:hypothetical protein ACFO1B_09570 [Dactylosporangium siamense]|uniref:hypothetical protein n=1 Tax=Dactylosporangium siamense TaxID=685454 RepID=UPI001945A2A7|nr:hypothetical protein [Dactylosporangium siamense]
MPGRWRRARPQPPLDPGTGGFSFAALKAMGNPMPLLVQNDGDALLELFLEPFGQDYLLHPGEAVTVTSYGRWDRYPFETIHEPNRITILATSCFATVSDAGGNEVPPANRRPPGVHQ